MIIKNYLLIIIIYNVFSYDECRDFISKYYTKDEVKSWDTLKTPAHKKPIYGDTVYYINMVVYMLT